MTRHSGSRIPTLAQRAWELNALKLPDAHATIRSGRELLYKFSISPSAFARTYECLLRVTPDARVPELIVLTPDLLLLAGNRPLPHIYPNAGKGTMLCLWLPRQGEWKPWMSLVDTYLPWTAEWLGYFENWLYTNNWSGGGAHPIPKRKNSESLPQIASIDNDLVS